MSEWTWLAGPVLSLLGAVAGALGGAYLAKVRVSQEIKAELEMLPEILAKVEQVTRAQEEIKDRFSMQQWRRDQALNAYVALLTPLVEQRQAQNEIAQLRRGLSHEQDDEKLEEAQRRLKAAEQRYDQWRGREAVPLALCALFAGSEALRWWEEAYRKDPSGFGIDFLDHYIELVLEKARRDLGISLPSQI